jgi:hypothetical protein
MAPMRQGIYDAVSTKQVNTYLCAKGTLKRFFMAFPGV